MRNTIYFFEFSNINLFFMNSDKQLFFKQILFFLLQDGRSNNLMKFTDNLIIFYQHCSFRNLLILYLFILIKNNNVQHIS